MIESRSQKYILAPSGILVVFQIIFLSLGRNKCKFYIHIYILQVMAACAIYIFYIYGTIHNSLLNMFFIT